MSELKEKIKIDASNRINLETITEEDNKINLALPSLIYDVIPNIYDIVGDPLGCLIGLYSCPNSTS